MFLWKLEKVQSWDSLKDSTPVNGVFNFWTEISWESPSIDGFDPMNCGALCLKQFKSGHCHTNRTIEPSCRWQLNGKCDVTPHMLPRISIFLTNLPSVARFSCWSKSLCPNNLPCELPSEFKADHCFCVKYTIYNTWYLGIYCSTDSCLCTLCQARLYLCHSAQSRT